MVSMTQENGFIPVIPDPAEAVMSLPLWKRLRRIAIILFIGLGSLWVIMVNWSEIAYQRSRSASLGAPTSYEFITMGVKAEMSESDVNHALNNADRILPHLYAYNSPWNGYINTYEFGYGPEVNIFLLKAKIALVKESVDVYFDAAGRAKKIRVLLDRKGWKSERIEADLESKRMWPLD